MRVLFISRSFPRDLRTYVSGTFQRMAMFIEAIGGIADLDMLFYVPPEVDRSPAAVSRLEKTLSSYWNTKLDLFLCPRVQREEPSSKWGLYADPALSFFRQPGYFETSGPRQVGAFEACLARQPDAIFAHRLVAMCPLLLTEKRIPPAFFDLDDIEHRALVRGIEDHAPWRDKIVEYARVPALWWGERRAIRLAHRTFVCSDLDREYLTKRCRLSRIATVPNAVTRVERLSSAGEPTLLFVGAYWYQPNADAAAFLIQQVWPRVRQAIPEAKLIIAGVNPELIPGYGSGIPGVVFTGFVEDLEALYRRSAVVCAPILSGAGTRVKIIEAAAYGRPVVSTSLGAEGLNLRDGREVLLRDDPESFAGACLELLRDPLLREKLAAAAHVVARTQYSRDNVVRVIQGYMKNERHAAETLQPVAEAVKP